MKAGSPRNAEEGAAPCSGYAAYQRKKPALKAKLGRVLLKQRNPWRGYQMNRLDRNFLTKARKNCDIVGVYS